MGGRSALLSFRRHRINFSLLPIHGNGLLQLEAKGETGDFDTILRDIEARDYQDSHRAYAPLKQAEDAVLIDTTHLTAEEAAEQITSAVLAKEA